MTMNKELVGRLEKDGWKFLGNYIQIGERSVYEDPIILSFSHVVRYTLVQRTDITYSLYVTGKTYNKAMESVQRIRDLKNKLYK